VAYGIGFFEKSQQFVGCYGGTDEVRNGLRDGCPVTHATQIGQPRRVATGQRVASQLNTASARPTANTGRSTASARLAALRVQTRVLIDGRNRLRACEIAGVAPTFAALNGHDAAAFIVSANLARRNLSKGQQAIALAMIYPEAAKVRRKGSGVLETEGLVKPARLSQARAVLRHSRAYAEDVLAARTSLDVVLRKVEEERQASQSVDANKPPSYAGARTDQSPVRAEPPQSGRCSRFLPCSFTRMGLPPPPTPPRRPFPPFGWLRLDDRRLHGSGCRRMAGTYTEFQ
jgi:hypothetical protein